MKRLVGLSLLCLFLVSVAGAASAWEFKMRGAFTWEYDYASQYSSAGFFGPHDFDGSPGGTSQRLNFWPGFQFGNRTVSGHDASYNSQYADLYPTVRLNKAVTMSGCYHIGAWGMDGDAVGDPGRPLPFLMQSEYYNYRLGGVQQSFSPGYWYWFRLRAKLPWGTLTVGKRPSRFGLGMLWNGDELASSESVVLGVNYGPMRFGLSFYPSRSDNEYYNFFDNSAIRGPQIAAAVHYISGSFMMGTQHTWVKRHRGAEGTIGARGTTRDREDWYWGVYAKYFTGRFFFNTEYDQFNRRDLFLGVGPGTRAYFDNEFESFVVESGLVFGPAKLSLLWARVTGIDRRPGYGRGGTAGIFKNNILPSGNLGNSLMFQPYSYLMVYSYGLGLGPGANAGRGIPGDPTNFNARTRNGQVMSASVWGARLDYAVACNLNVYGSFFYAIRPEKGYGWGFLSPTPAPAGVATAGTIRYRLGGAAGAAAARLAPAIPDDYLGWEADIGVDWQLLENYRIAVIIAYWQPGDWFKFACVDTANPGWTAPGPGNLWGINPDRGIDPVCGFNFVLKGEF